MEQPMQNQTALAQARMQGLQQLLAKLMPTVYGQNQATAQTALGGAGQGGEYQYNSMLSQGRKSALGQM